ANYTPSAVIGTTIDGQIWGFPTEVDNYCLVYNKELFGEAGFTEPPATWAELVEMAPKLTKYDAEGNITQYGFAFLSGWESAVVHPFLSLLWSNGGEFLSEDYKECLVNSEEGIGALEAELELFRKRGTDASGSVWEFPNGTVAMMIMAPWYESSLKVGLQEKYEDVVGVAPIPILKEKVNAQYTWFACVGSGSKHKEEAWDFLRWFCSDVQPATNTTRQGDLMAGNVGALPPRKIDMENQETLGDLYTQTFIEELEYARGEPNIFQGAEIKRILMNEIVKTWNAQKTAKQALDDAVKQINEILAEFY
ncbi:extracellular solute-binding protein, partial [Candidatus Aerophobetes bacterium]|nr:extracellular solute-binding protein [Candidatus Aerophobetes bacterium]